MNVWRGRSNNLWFEMSRDSTHIKLHSEYRTGYEDEPTKMSIKDFESCGFELAWEGDEGERIARERIGNVLLAATHPENGR